MFSWSISSTVASATLTQRALARISASSRSRVASPELLGVTQPSYRMQVVQDHGRGNDGPGERTSPYLVHTSDEAQGPTSAATSAQACWRIFSIAWVAV
jgi:hypothetical protein